jgi:hypothetical protein
VQRARKNKNCIIGILYNVCWQNLAFLRELIEKVFRRINFIVDKREIDDVVNCVPGAVERMLKNFQIKVTQLQQRKLSGNDRSSDDSFGMLAILYANYVGEFEMGEDPTPVAPRQKEGGVTPIPYRPVANQPQSIYQQHSEPSIPPIHHFGAPQQHQQQQPQQQYRQMTNGGHWEEIIAEKDAKINELTQTNQVSKFQTNFSQIQAARG